MSRADSVLTEDFPASMRPRPDGRGNQELQEGVKRDTAASMRPRPDGRGNDGMNILQVFYNFGFNEAATGRPRKSGFGLLWVLPNNLLQ